MTDRFYFENYLRLLLATLSILFFSPQTKIRAADEANRFLNRQHEDDLSEVQAGGVGGNFYRGADGFSIPMSTASSKDLKSFVIGKSLFKENWVATPASVRNRQGLGPVFHAQSCSTCHFKDGRGEPPATFNDSMVSMLVRLSVPGANAHGGPKPTEHYGDQFNHRSIVGVKSNGDVHVHFDEVQAKYPDGIAYSLLSPRYDFVNLNYGPMPKDLMISARVAPQVVGLGLLEAIPEKVILALVADPQKAGTGISGHPNWVWDFRANKKSLGRFGWKANQPSVFQQNTSAFFGDIGITSAIFPHKNCGPTAEDCQKAPSLSHPDIDNQDLLRVEAYVKLISVPARRNLKDPDVREGQKLFHDAQCSLCHTPRFMTGIDPRFPELSKQKIFPYTDLLVHDMGEGLADHRPDYEANGREWRTAPLWSVGVIPEVNGHSRLLHDGRARSAEEAILWHGGEAETAKNNFMNLNKDDRKKLIRFLEAL